MKILVINTGSSSLKYQVIDMSNENLLAKGICDRIGLEQSFLKHTKISNEPVVIEKDLYNHNIAIQEVIKILTDVNYGVISTMDEIVAVGHRVVHGGENFHDSVIINEEVKNAIRDCCDLAPLHNPPNIVGIEACQQIMPKTPMIAVFDTAFHRTLPKHAYIYPLPYEIYEKYKIRKYGFHGTSHKYVAQRAADLLNKPIEQLKIISCHLGNGASICAIKYGNSVETSMGFTPLQGLVMGTRSGTIDPEVISYLMEKENMSIKDISQFLNKKSGVLGISGVSSDFRDIEEAANKGHERAQLALDIFCYRVKRFIGDYTAVMGGVDVIVFTAGIGENNGEMRQSILDDMEYLGVSLDPEKNKVRSQEKDVSSDNSKVRVFVIPTNEELSIARETIKALN